MSQTSDQIHISSYADRLAKADKKQERIQVTLACLMFLAAGFIFYWNKHAATIPPPPNSSGYYTGPWVNKNGDLVSEDGKILKHNYRRTATSSVGTASAASASQNPVTNPDANWIPE